MTTHRIWLGINPAECLKDSDTPHRRERELSRSEPSDRSTKTPAALAMAVAMGLIAIV